MSLEKPENLPIGIGGKRLNEVADTLPAVEVENVVSWVNPDMELPFKIEAGKSTSVVLMFTRKPSRHTKKKGGDLEVNSEHYRSSILGRVIFRDKQGRLYRDIDMKGNGYLDEDDEGNLFVQVWADTNITKSQNGPWGLLGQWAAFADRNNSETLLGMGVRSHRALAIVELREIVDSSGKKISIDEAIEKNILSIFFDPVVEIRAYSTKMRVSDVEQKDGIYLKDAIQLVSQELGMNLGPGEYFKWFCETLAVQAAKLHDGGYTHGFSWQNVTLDCRLVDLDALHLYSGIDDFKSDRRKALELLSVLFNSMRKFYEMEEVNIKGIFNRSYKREQRGLNKQKLSEQAEELW